MVSSLSGCVACSSSAVASSSPEAGATDVPRGFFFFGCCLCDRPVGGCASGAGGAETSLCGGAAGAGASGAGGAETSNPGGIVMLTALAGGLGILEMHEVTKASSRPSSLLGSSSVKRDAASGSNANAEAREKKLDTAPLPSMARLRLREHESKHGERNSVRGVPQMQFGGRCRSLVPGVP